MPTPTDNPDVLTPVEQAEEEIRHTLDLVAVDILSIVTRRIVPHDIARGLHLTQRLAAIFSEARAIVNEAPPGRRSEVPPGVAGFIPDLMGMLREQVDVLRQQSERRNAAIPLPPRPPIYELESAVRAAEGLGDTALVEAAKAALKKAILEMAEAPVDEGASDPPQPFNDDDIPV